MILGLVKGIKEGTVTMSISGVNGKTCIKEGTVELNASLDQ